MCDIHRRARYSYHTSSDSSKYLKKLWVKTLGSTFARNIQKTCSKFILILGTLLIADSTDGGSVADELSKINHCTVGRSLIFYKISAPDVLRSLQRLLILLIVSTIQSVEFTADFCGIFLYNFVQSCFAVYLGHGIVHFDHSRPWDCSLWSFKKSIFVLFCQVYGWDIDNSSWFFEWRASEKNYAVLKVERSAFAMDCGGDSTSGECRTHGASHKNKKNKNLRPAQSKILVSSVAPVPQHASFVCTKNISHLYALKTIIIKIRIRTSTRLKVGVS